MSSTHHNLTVGLDGDRAQRVELATSAFALEIKCRAIEGGIDRPGGGEPDHVAVLIAIARSAHEDGFGKHIRAVRQEDGGPATRTLEQRCGSYLRQLHPAWT